MPRLLRAGVLRRLAADIAVSIIIAIAILPVLQLDVYSLRLDGSRVNILII